MTLISVKNRSKFLKATLRFSYPSTTLQLTQRARETLQFNTCVIHKRCEHGKSGSIIYPGRF